MQGGIQIGARPNTAPQVRIDSTRRAMLQRVGCSVGSSRGAACTKSAKSFGVWFVRNERSVVQSAAVSLPEGGCAGGATAAEFGINGKAHGWNVA